MKYHIISIGVSKHQVVGPDLDYASKDAVDFHELIIQNIPNIGTKKLLTDSEATLSAIQTALALPELLEASEDDALFFFFSGHGTVAKNDGKLAHYLVTFDATSDIAHSCVSVEYLQAALSKIRCKAQFVFVDSCFSGALSKGTKYLASPKYKDLKALPKLAEVLPGVGNVIFTASKDDEEAIELDALEHGLFTYALLSELQKKRSGDKYPIADIFDPVTKSVIEEAKKHGHTQTPTILGRLEGSVSLPVFNIPLKITPQVLDTPRFQELEGQSFTAPELTLSDKDQAKAINDMIKMVMQTQKDKAGRSTFSNFCANIRQLFGEEWNEIFQETHSGDKIPDAVAKIEGKSFQLIALGAIVATYGNEQQSREYAETLASIFELEQGRAGLVALIDVPEIVILISIYVIGISCLAVSDLDPFNVLMRTPVMDFNSYKDPAPLYQHYTMQYLSALGGYAPKVMDHVIEVIKSYEWLSELLPGARGKVVDFLQQVNFLICMQAEAKNVRSWPDFGRYYPGRVRPLVDRLKFDDNTIKQVASLIGVKPAELRKNMYEFLKVIYDRGFGGTYFWESVQPKQLLTQAERDEMGLKDGY